MVDADVLGSVIFSGDGGSIGFKFDSDPPPVGVKKPPDKVPKQDHGNDDHQGAQEPDHDESTVGSVGNNGDESDSGEACVQEYVQLLQ